jgi:hypothetical protein
MVLGFPNRLLSGILALGILVSTGCGPQETSEPPSGSDSLFSIHWLAEEPAPGVRICEFFSTGEEVGVETPPVLSLAHFDSVTVETEGDYFVAVWMTTDGQARLEAASRENVGRRLAIVFDGQVRATPLIRAELRLESFPIYEISEEEARELAARLNDALFHLRDSTNRSPP